MPKFGRRSNIEKGTCHPDLIRLLDEAIKYYDFSIVCGHRDERKQKELVDSGFSKTLKSKHNFFPSLAVDIVPYPTPENWGDIDYKNPPEAKELQRQVLERARFYHLIGYIKGIAHMLNIDIRCGADWDDDTIFTDQKFHDLVHIELKYEKSH